jgi:hypothetical protein
MEDNLKEIGGYFGLELKRGREYYADAIKLNSARNCLKYILLAQKPTKLYMPYYMDKSMIEDSLRELVEYSFYNINERFEIESDLDVKEGEKILFNNSCSSKNNYITTLAKKYGNKLIVDNTHSFFSKPLPGIDTVYSLGSKYFGVPGGGYLYTSKKLNTEFEQDYSHAKMSHILGRTDKTASEFFEAFQQSKKGRNNQPIRHMSKITQTMMASIDYENAQLVRERNFYYLHGFLGTWNEIALDLTFMEGPMFYPMLVRKENLRQTLIKNKIYVPTFWPEVLEAVGANAFEKRVSTYMLPLPIDQRYDLADMRRIVEIISTEMK